MSYNVDFQLRIGVREVCWNVFPDAREGRTEGGRRLLQLQTDQQRQRGARHTGGREMRRICCSPT